MRTLGIRVALAIALVSPAVLWIVSARGRGAWGGGGPVLAASLAGFLSIGVQSMVMAARRIPESARGEAGLFGACLAFFGGCMVSSVMELGDTPLPIWLHLLPPIAIGAVWAGTINPGSATARPLDDMLSALTRASDKEPVASHIVDHLSALQAREDSAVYATAVLIVCRPLAVEGFDDKVEGLLADMDLAACPAPLCALLAYELVLARVRLGDPVGAREVLGVVSSGGEQAVKQLAAAALARVLVAEGQLDAALAALQSHGTVGERTGDVDALDAHAASALHAAFAVVHMARDDVHEAERSLERLATRGGGDELRHLASGTSAVAERAAHRLARAGG